MSRPCEAGDLPPAVRQELVQLAVPAVDIEELSAGSPSSMKVRPASTSVTTASAASRPMSSSAIDPQTLTSRAPQCAQGSAISRRSRMTGRIAAASTGGSRRCHGSAAGPLMTFPLREFPIFYRPCPTPPHRRCRLADFTAKSIENFKQRLAGRHADDRDPIRPPCGAIFHLMSGHLMSGHLMSGYLTSGGRRCGLARASRHDVITGRSVGERLSDGARNDMMAGASPGALGRANLHSTRAHHWRPNNHLLRPAAQRRAGSYRDVSRPPGRCRDRDRRVPPSRSDRQLWVPPAGPVAQRQQEARGVGGVRLRIESLLQAGERRWMLQQVDLKAPYVDRRHAAALQRPSFGQCVGQARE